MGETSEVPAAVIELERPLPESEGQAAISKLSLRRARTGDLRPMPASEYPSPDDIMKLGSRLAAIDDRIVDQLDGPDVHALTSAAAEQLPDEAVLEEAREARVLKLPDGSAKLVLSKPLELGSERITELVAKRERLRGRAMRKMPAPDSMRLGDFLSFFGSLCGQSAPIIDKLEVVDGLLAVGIAADFFGRTRRTGR